MASTNSAAALLSSDWAALSTELDQWSDLEQRATFWWRDDDATQPSQSLDRLLKLADGIPLALAVIPATAKPALADKLQGASGITILQHGYIHADHATSGERKAEYGQHRPLTLMVEEIAQGATLLRDIFYEDATSILVPPWNRIADDLIPQLPEAGISALSSIGPRSSKIVIVQVNVHIDIIDWRGSQGFRGSPVLESIIDHLSRRRSGGLDVTEATGVLTHHINHDDGCWNFMTDLLAMTKYHPAACWISTDEALGT